MGRSKRKKSKKRLNPEQNTFEKNKFAIFKKMNHIILWLAATGILAVFVNYTFSFITGHVEVKFIKPVGRGYEFKLINMNSTDQVVEYFRIVPDLKQKFLFKVTENVYAKDTNNGALLPGGNVSYVPAYEFKEMDGHVLSAGSEVAFRLPPLTSRSYMLPESIVVFAEYKTKSKNSFLGAIERFFISIGSKTSVNKVKYLVSENYWTPIEKDNLIDAIKIACRDDDVFGKSSICDKYN